jgi:hypothetical protein
MAPLRATRFATVESAAEDLFLAFLTSARGACSMNDEPSQAEILHSI